MGGKQPDLKFGGGVGAGHARDLWHCQTLLSRARPAPTAAKGDVLPARDLPMRH